MKRSLDRRGFLGTTLGAAAALSLTQLAARPVAARDNVEPISAMPLNDTLSVFSGAGCNVLAARDGAGVALVDGGLEERSGDLVKAVERAFRAPIHTLFNTHWHPEQTGSNLRLGKAGATIIAHENTRQWLGYANPVPAQPGRTYGPLPPKGRPNKTLYATQQLQIGAEPVECGYLLQAHTDGDIYVFFRKSNVLMTGGAVSGAGWPIIDYQTGGWLLGMIDALRTLGGLADANTRIVPANGPLLTRADLETQRSMYAKIADRLTKMLRQGFGPEEAIAHAPTAEFDAQWGDPKQFVALAFKSLWGHFAPDA